MKIKPKEVLVNLPCQFEFQNEEELAQMAANINSILSGRTRVKYDVMGYRGEMLIGLLYTERNKEYLEYREFIKSYVIEDE